MSIINPYLEENLKHKSSVPPEEARLRRRSTALSVMIACILIIAKLLAYIGTDSVSILSSLLDSTLDAVVSIIMLVSVRYAMTPADSAHRYGHGKLEPLAALGQSFFIGASAIVLIFEGISRIAKPEAVTAPAIGIYAMLLSIVLTLVLITYQAYVIRKTASVAIEADSLHYKGDLLMNIGVIIALVLSRYTDFPYFDPGFALIVAGILIKSAWEIGTGSIDMLMDRELPEEDRQKIEIIVQAHPKVHSIHDLRTRSSGIQTFIEFHLEMDGRMSLEAAHDVTEDIEMKLYEAFPTAEVMIHQEPAGIKDDRLDDRLDDSA